MGRKSKYEPDMPDRLIEFMAEGLSFEACCGELGVSKDTGYEWLKRFPEFAEAKLLGEGRGQLFWERKAITAVSPYMPPERDLSGVDEFERERILEADRRAYQAAMNFKFNATVFVFTMKNRFNWRDKRELSGSVGVGITRQFETMSNEQIETRITEILARLPKPAPKATK